MQGQMAHLPYPMPLPQRLLIALSRGEPIRVGKGEVLPLCFPYRTGIVHLLRIGINQQQIDT